MNNGGKIAVTLLLIIVFIFASFGVIAINGSKTFLAMLGLGLFFGISAMWKKPKEKSSNEIKLDKTQYPHDEKNLTKE
jgi:hypothetical protein